SSARRIAWATPRAYIWRALGGFGRGAPQQAKRGLHLARAEAKLLGDLLLRPSPGQEPADASRGQHLLAERVGEVAAQVEQLKLRVAHVRSLHTAIYRRHDVLS